jgi:hypothetical protein
LFVRTDLQVWTLLTSRAVSMTVWRSLLCFTDLTTNSSTMTNWEKVNQPHSILDSQREKHTQWLLFWVEQWSLNERILSLSYFW